ncbi:MAG TPA: hypothetical protein VHV75_15280 [Solirubrobacteraceae bacterium]|jgi:hypothetical protein|nr:hypothetical protein [Solirubrobacteraceae bacterium]
MRRIRAVELTLLIVIATVAMGGLVQLVQPQVSAGHNGPPARTEPNATVSRAAAVTAGSCALSLVRGRRIRVAGGVYALAAGYASVWALAHETVSKLDPTSGLVVARIRISGDSAYGQITTVRAASG